MLSHLSLQDIEVLISTCRTSLVDLSHLGHHTLNVESMPTARQHIGFWSLTDHAGVYILGGLAPVKALAKCIALSQRIEALPSNTLSERGSYALTQRLHHGWGVRNRREGRGGLGGWLVVWRLSVRGGRRH